MGAACCAHLVEMAVTLYICYSHRIPAGQTWCDGGGRGCGGGRLEGMSSAQAADESDVRSGATPSPPHSLYPPQAPHPLTLYPVMMLYPLTCARPHLRPHLPPQPYIYNPAPLPWLPPAAAVGGWAGCATCTASVSAVCSCVRV